LIHSTQRANRRNNTTNSKRLAWLHKEPTPGYID
jgi:hypothetical protein